VDNIFYGLGEVVAIGQSVFSPYFHKGIEPLPFDLERARALLTDAGWVDNNGDGIREKTVDGKELNLEFELLIAASSSEQRTMVQMYKEDLLKCGVRLKPNPAESALWSQKIHERSFDGFIIFWTAGMDSNPQQIWESKRADDPGSNNYTGYRNPQADRIFEALVTEFDMERRKALYREWYEIQFDDQPYTWIWSIKSPICCNADWRLPEPQLVTPKLDRRLIFKWKKR
jgi:peptide/nickel transport system substrate-binding protein